MINSWIIKHLKLNQLSQTKLARLISRIIDKDVTAQRISNIINGKGQLFAVELIAMQEIFGEQATLSDIGVDWQRPVKPHPKAEIPIDIQKNVIEFLGDKGALSRLNGKEAAELVTALCIALTNTRYSDLSIDVFYEILSAMNQTQLMEELDPQYL